MFFPLRNVLIYFAFTIHTYLKLLTFLYIFIKTLKTKKKFREDVSYLHIFYFVLKCTTESRFIISELVVGSVEQDFRRIAMGNEYRM